MCYNLFGDFMKKIKNTKKVYHSKNNIEYGADLKKLLIILGSILLVLLILYLIIAIFVTKDIKLFNNSNNNTTTETTIQYSEILAGETFNKKSNEYYVIFTDSTGNYYSVYKNIVDKNTDKKIYIVDVSDPLNKLYISEETNPNAQKSSELKVKDNTLIKIIDGQNKLYIENKDEILSYFN